MRDSFVYFAEAKSVPFGPLKIGRSTNPHSRLGELQTGNWEVLQIIATIRTADASGLERRLHEEFAADRLIGEWFRFSPGLWDRIVELADEFKSEGLDS